MELKRGDKVRIKESAKEAQGFKMLEKNFSDMAGVVTIVYEQALAAGQYYEIRDTSGQHRQIINSQYIEGTDESEDVKLGEYPSEEEEEILRAKLIQDMPVELKKTVTDDGVNVEVRETQHGPKESILQNAKESLEVVKTEEVVKPEPEDDVHDMAGQAPDIALNDPPPVERPGSKPLFSVPPRT